MSIKIPIQADFDPSSVQQQIQQFQQQLNALGTQIAQANKVKFNPVGKTTVDDMKKVVAQFEALKKVSGDMRKRINATGQQGAGFFDLDWSKMYPDQSSRARQMQKAFEYVSGRQFHAPITPPHTPRHPGGGGSGGGGGGGGAGAVVTQVAGAGLRAMGPAGGVAANALGTGMSMGAGAGMAGLLGGLGALAIGGLISAAKENLDKAEANAVAYDTLKRTLGDVNVSFNGLKSVVEGASQNIKLTFDETAKLASQYAKAGNLPGSQYGSLFQEMQTGVGLSRSFGLDPSQGVGFLGTMRGNRLSKDEQDSRKFALLIGETIAKSDAFAKADEVMEAIAGYATMQTRASLGANVGGYAGQFSALVGSGIPGLDPAGAGGLLSRINASLMAGGAKGEASQFFSGMIGARNGLDPFQLQVWREGGAFETLGGAFGPGSVASRYGMKGPGGNQTFLGASLGALRGQYGGNRGMLAQATANHLGINMRQAMALLSVDPNQAGEMEARLKGSGVDLTSMNANGIGTLSKVMFGSDRDRQGVATELMGRSGRDALTAGERAALEEVMAGGDKEKQTDLLTRLVASRDQEQTQGKDIRDSKNIVDNIKTDIASKLIPLTQEMRNGIMSIAGVGKDGLTSEDIMSRVINADSEGRKRSIAQKFDPKIDELGERRDDLRARIIDEDKIRFGYRDKPEILEQKLRERNENLQKLNAVEVEIAGLEKEKARLMAEENKRRDEEIAAMRKNAELRRQAEDKIHGTSSSFSGGGNVSSASFPTPGGGHGGLGGDLFSALIQQESGGRHTDANGRLITSSAGAMGIAQLMPGTARRPGFGITPIRDNSKEENLRVGREYLNALLQKYGGDQRKALAAYNAGPGRVDSAIAKYGDDWFSHMPAETRGYVPSIHRRMQKGTPLPDQGGTPSGGSGFRIGVDPLEVIHRNERGEQIGQTQRLATRIAPATPFGMGG